MLKTTQTALLIGSIAVSGAACKAGADGVEKLEGAAVTANVPVGPRPESITRAWEGKLYVSIQGPSGALGTFDGEVRQVDLDTGVVTPFVSGLENPRGLAFTGEFLIAADQQKIYKIDQAGNKTVLAAAADFPFPAVFFNDAAPERGGKAVYVSEMGRRDIIREVPPAPNAGRLIQPDSDAAFAVPATSRIYRITMDGNITSVVEPSRKLLVINGVTEADKGLGDHDDTGKGPAGGHLLATDFFHGNIVKIDPKSGSETILATALRGADGLEQAADGTIFVASFELGAVWRMDRNGDNMKVLIDHVGFQTTADLYVDEAAKKLYVPNTVTGSIMVMPSE
jgi:sugar lactone lactonase YvrE